MVTQTLQALPPGTHMILADVGTITSKTSGIGRAILAATVVFAVVAAFFTQAQRKWMVVVTILLIGSFTFMIVDDPKALLEDGGTFIKTNVWDPLLSA
ncbi:TcpD family membrane protein [Streptomyces sp. Isolate_45]|uniref:TcpD family membrane protein n=1 Tax=Streptomyces sp. Isolate_45 TaxID=2950111 RepID=UPI002481DD3E|nr:TcpD family membrane protein [Streptomyces sp. Isolate_45]MDA5282545.1 TcpD family membrane protein [Streptomyces sp. Isolate_45]